MIYKKFKYSIGAPGYWGNIQLGDWGGGGWEVSLWSRNGIGAAHATPIQEMSWHVLFKGIVWRDFVPLVFSREKNFPAPEIILLKIFEIFNFIIENNLLSHVTVAVYSKSWLEVTPPPIRHGCHRPWKVFCSWPKDDFVLIPHLNEKWEF